MFMFNQQIWEQHKERFVQSYRNVCSIARAAGYAEMTDHRLLTDDRSVQQTAFADDLTITVNFGDRPFQLPDGATIGPRSFRAEGLR